MFLTENIAGAFTSYQSFFVKGSTLEVEQGREDGGWERVKAIYHPTSLLLCTWHGACLNKYLPQSSGTQLQRSLLITLWKLQTSVVVRHNFSANSHFLFGPLFALC